ncbi:MAG: hypothetical protein LCH26_07650 [Proteobacteria bacterium]|nr:hypothetical protein [Pseudomonadota bacterium]
MTVSIAEQVSLAQQSAKKPEIHKKGENKSFSSQMIMDNFQQGVQVFLATLKNQDPTNPMDPKEMAQHFSMFAQLMGMSDIKKLLESMSCTMARGQSIQAANQLNNLVKVRTNTFNYNPQEPCEVGFYAPANAQKASIIICDSKGEFVRIMDGDIKPSEDGYHGIVWDGKDNAGETVTPGSYSFYVLAKDARDNIIRTEDDKPIEVETSVFGRAMGASFKDNQSQLMVSGKHYPMNDLISIQSGAIFEEYANRNTQNQNRNQGSLAQNLQAELSQGLAQVSADGTNPAQVLPTAADAPQLPTTPDPILQTQNLADQLMQQEIAVS